MLKSQLGLFDAYGIEMEYMLVDPESLDVRPVADQVLALIAGETTSDVEIGPITWSNELALHVLELKTTLPASRLKQLPSQFETAIRDMQSTLEKLDLLLLPTAVHPWMDPTVETQLWPHEGSEIYREYDRVFDCRSHGWANVQSVHLNLPFDGDDEFARLHAATRIVLPLLPALAASSPILDGRYTGLLDTRMMLYADHCARLPVLTGDLIPERVFDQSNYEREIYQRIATETAALHLSPDMKVEFLNARGAIARFDRGSIELRVMDVQEYPGADVAICAAVSALIRSLCDEKWSSFEQQKQMPTLDLRQVLDATSARAEHAVIDNPSLLNHFGIHQSTPTGQQVWTTILDRLRREDAAVADLFAPLQIILESGTLASRICTALGPEFSTESLADVYREVAESLKQWEPFLP